MLGDAFRSPLLYLVRHGTTDLNDSGHFRGFEDVSLNDAGMEAAEEVSNFLSFRPVGQVVSSTLIRAVQTAQTITQSFDRNPNLMPWNIGDFSGKLRSKYQSELQNYIDNPDRVIPSGESLNQFRARIESTLNNYLIEATYEQPLVIVTHTSDITAAHQMFDPDWEDYQPEDGDVVEPGGIVAVYMTEDGRIDMEPVLGAVIHEQTPNAS